MDRLTPAERVTRLSPWAALVLLGAWAAWPHPAWLAAATLAFLPALRPGAHRRDPRAALGLVLVLPAVAVGLWATGRDARLARDFESYWAARETEVFEILSADLEEQLDRGDRATTTLAGWVADGKLPSTGALSDLLASTGMTAAAVYDPSGRPLVWWGEHRGPVPEEVQAGGFPYVYAELPLVSHLYFTRIAEGGRVVVAALLLRSDLPTDPEARGDFVARVRAETGEEVRISSADRASVGEVFDFRWGDTVLFSLGLERPGEATRRARLLADARVAVVVIVTLAWLLLALGAPPGRARGLPAAATGFALAALVPVNRIPGLAEFTSAADVLLPLPGGLSLARLLLVVGVGVLALGIVPAARIRGGRPVPAAALVVVSFPLAGWAVAMGSSAGFLARSETGWVLLTLGLAGVLTIVAWVALAVARGGGPHRLRVALGALLALGLGLTGAVLAARGPGLHPALLSLGAVPLALARSAGPRGSGRSGLLALAVALLVGTSVALPFSWGERIRARMDVAEERVDRLGTDVDPYLQFLLERTAARVDSLDADGAGPLELLYKAWRASGLAEAGYPVWLTLWSAGDLNLEELRVGFPGDARPSVVTQHLERARATDSVLVERFAFEDAHYLLLVPLEGGRVVTAVVPPLRGGTGSSFLGPLFGSLAPDVSDPLTLIPLLPGESVTREALTWLPTPSGWQGEMALDYPEQGYHVHYDVELPGPLVALARGTLLLALAVGGLGPLWVLGRFLGDRRGRVSGPEPLGLGSFRARVTFALFAFFALSLVIFGSLAYRTIAGASQRTARVLSERAVNDAAGWYFDVQGRMTLLSARVGADLVEYRDGELRDASVEELVALGLYEGWVPFEVHRVLLARESLLESATTDLGSWEYVTAYRRLPDGDVLAAPVPLQAGAAAVQSREVAHLLGFAALAGGALSMVLALLVGRTLTRPIQTLRVASERVGSGNLGVRLPGGRGDEFGAVFEAFNRMVRRLRKARRDLVRTTRRTQAIVEDAATGVLAFDAEGAVTLVNPRALELLDLDLRVGEPLPAGVGAAAEFVHWMELYFRDGLREASTELQSGERRIRVRARRISREGPLAGAVVSLEDVTDELRTERILAWGEMARQVAHEVKNPLTPIKLSVQHLRRAWEDRRPDFDAILRRNAEAMLREIDRLATIASSFSRFGAPGAGGDHPVGPVDLASVVHDVLTLYEVGEGPIHFESRLPGDLPPVAAREAELKEVLVNLLENARAAILDEGRVRVGARVEGSGVVLTVTDDGGGIPAELMPRIFEPHFSTRTTGAGLGLAIVRRLVEGWGATVAIESREQRGTEVTVRMAVAGSAEEG